MLSVHYRPPEDKSNFSPFQPGLVVANARRLRSTYGYLHKEGLDTGVKRCQSFWLVCVLSSTLVLGYFLLRNKATKAPKGLLLPWPVNGKTILTTPENGYLTQTQGPVGTCQAWLGLEKNLEMMSRLGLHFVMSTDSSVWVSVYA